MFDAEMQNYAACAVVEGSACCCTKWQKLWYLRAFFLVFKVLDYTKKRIFAKNYERRMVG